MTSELQIRVVPAIAEVPAAAWDACANPRSVPEVCPYNPFVSHAFLHALEASGSASARTGWRPQHLVAEIGERVVGVVPCYLKSHSRGEYVFDAGWAEAYERAGGAYYPKLQVSVPFTPVPGPRLLVHPEADAEEVRRVLLAGLIRLTELHKASSLHITFLTEPEWRAAGEAGYLLRQGTQYHWENQGYADFEGF